MNSHQKLIAMIDSVHAMSDDEIDDAFPLDIVPPPLVRSAITMIEPQIPRDPAELDAWLDKVTEFCQALKSDPSDGPVLPAAAEAGV